MSEIKLKLDSSKKCRWCGGRTRVKYSGLKDKLMGVRDVFKIRECLVCGVAFTDPMPGGDLGVLYPPMYLSDRKPRQGFDIERWYREDRYVFDFSLVKKATGLDIRSFGSYLDVGCGTGEQVVFVKQRGCRDCWGLDKFDHIKGKIKNVIKKGIEEYFPKRRFKVVSLFAVLEHVVNPREVLRHIRKNVIERDGFLIIEVPNYGSIERKIFGKKWYCLDVPRHLWHYNEVSVRRLLEDCGYKVVKTYKKNAWLHPVSFAPSVVADADMGKVWGEVGDKGHWYWLVMKCMWAGLTVISIPINWVLSAANQASVMMVIARPK